MNFDGYYVKVVDDKRAFAVIFGRNRARGKRSSFVQVITRERTYNAVYNYGEYRARKKPFSVQVANNRADGCGMVVDIADGEASFVADLSFDAITPIRGDAMGFFRFFPFMECKHKIISMGPAPVYIEGDSGCSFPRKYFWTQCNLFDGFDDLSVVAMCAVIPYLGFRFLGTICIIHFNGREYRLATYRGARVVEFTSDKLVIKQGRKILEIEISDADKNSHELFAPARGRMERMIKETVFTTARYKFTINDRVVFDTTSPYAAFEFSEK